MLLPADQRCLLGAFVRARRQALVHGVPAGRRRTPGLRREEVAQLCGLSTTWYTWIEQGRDISVSAAALARLADALRLTEAERAYLFELTRRRDPAPPEPMAASMVPDELAAVVLATAAPAYLIDRLWQARAWNDAAGHLFGRWLGGPEACLLRYVFLDPSARDFISDWPDRARRLVAEFRADLAHLAQDRAACELVGDLRQDSAAFARLWDDQAVLAREGGLRVFDHPQDGRLGYRQVTLVPAAQPDHKLVVLLPAEA